MSERNKEIIHLQTDLDYYGASYVLAEYCGLKKPIYYYIYYYIWQHGWLPDYYNIHPFIVIPDHYSANKEKVYLVARNDQKEYLHKHGYRNVHAVGLPIIYTKPEPVTRKKNSLLVMPVHSLVYTSHEHWGFQKYADQVNAIRDQFDEVAVCIHSTCIQRGYWVKEFEAYGFKIIEGANINDKNAFYKLQHILSSYEFVTTNGFGSHILYAAFFGAKVSLYGDFAEFQAKDFATDPFYISFPEILEPTVQLTSERAIREKMPDFFVFPKDAPLRLEWARKEIGFDNKLSPAQMRKLIRWDAVSLLIIALKKRVFFLAPIVGRIKSFLNPKKQLDVDHKPV